MHFTMQSIFQSIYIDLSVQIFEFSVFMNHQYFRTEGVVMRLSSVLSWRRHRKCNILMQGVPACKSVCISAHKSI